MVKFANGAYVTFSDHVAVVEQLHLLLRAWAQTHSLPTATTQTNEMELALKLETVKALGGGFQQYYGAMEHIMQARAALAEVRGKK